MKVLTVRYIAEALGRLRQLGAHRNIIMYLCIKRAATEQQTQQEIKIDFREFFEHFLTVRNAPSNRLHKPYIIPFEGSDAKLWFNKNLAGSFAPSSIRPENPINNVISLSGAGANVRYSLRHNHAQQVVNSLLYGKKIPALDLAIFLYRDFGFNADTMDAAQLINLFQTEFGYLYNGNPIPDFGDIFSVNTDVAPEDLFSPFIQE